MGLWVSAQMMTIKERDFLCCANLKLGGRQPPRSLGRVSPAQNPSSELPSLATHPGQL